MIKMNRIVLLAVFFGIMAAAAFGAEEPRKPVVDYPLDPDKEVKVQQLAGLKPKEAFERLKDIDLVTDEPALNKAIFTAFNQRKQRAIDIALEYLKLSRIGSDAERLMTRNTDLFVAKKIVQVFSDDAVPRLLDLYKKGDTITRANIIRVSGSLAGGEAIRRLLVEALDDTSPVEENAHPEAIGDPLRICDLAYNQLLLRDEMSDIPRTIGTTHGVEKRDESIEILKGRVR